jgi:hypothetical protein
LNASGNTKITSATPGAEQINRQSQLYLLLVFSIIFVYRAAVWGYFTLRKKHKKTWDREAAVEEKHYFTFTSGERYSIPLHWFIALLLKKTPWKKHYGYIRLITLAYDSRRTTRKEVDNAFKRIKDRWSNSS